MCSDTRLDLDSHGLLFSLKCKKSGRKGEGEGDGDIDRDGEGQGEGDEEGERKGERREFGVSADVSAYVGWQGLQVDDSS